MLSKLCNLSASTVMLLALGLQGCGIGIDFVETPEVPSPRYLSLGDVTFDICDPDSHVKEWWTQRFEPALLRDFGIQTRSGKPLGNKPFFHFLVTPEHPTDSPLLRFSLLLSLLTFSAIPGYYVYDTPFSFQFSAMDANGITATGDFSYQYHTRTFLWAPLIVYPDFVVSINGGYINKAKNYRAQELLLRKFILDAAAQLDKASAQESIGLPLPPLDCPVSTTK